MPITVLPAKCLFESCDLVEAKTINGEMNDLMNLLQEVLLVAWLDKLEYTRCISRPVGA